MLYKIIYKINASFVNNKTIRNMSINIISLETSVWFWCHDISLREELVRLLQQFLQAGCHSCHQWLKAPNSNITLNTNLINLRKSVNSLWIFFYKKKLFLTAKIKNFTWSSYSPHWMKVKHGRLQLCKLNGSNADGPDVTQLVVTAFPFNSCHLRSHPLIINNNNSSVH